MTSGGPVNCLLCLKSLTTHKPLKWQEDEDEYVDGIAYECSKTVNSQLGVIFLLRKLLEIPTDVCGVLLQSYGDPYSWISCCHSCSILVEKGRQIFRQIALLQKQLEKVQDDLKSSIYNSEELFPNSETVGKGATGIIRCLIKNEELKKGRIQANNLQLNCSTLDACFPQIYNDMGTTSVNEIINVNRDSEMLIKIENEFYKNSDRQELEYHAEVITGDLYIPPGDSDGANPSKAGNSTRKPKNSKRKRISPKCDVCGKIFRYPNDLKRHQRIHTGESPFKCDICGKIFYQSSHLKEHIRIHTGEKPFPCHICGKRFSQPSNLNKHIILIHTEEKPFKCEICGKAFKVSDSHKKHILIHSGLKPFKCKTCGKRFTASRSLKSHIMLHTGKSPFKCDICGKILSQSGHLKEHIRIHTGEKPFVCFICGKGFAQAGAVKTHRCTPTGKDPSTATETFVEKAF